MRGGRAVSFLATIGLTGLPSGAAAGPATPLLSGIYSNVQLSPVTGDLGGLEIEFHPDPGKPYVLVVFCDGWCNQFHKAPLALRGPSFSFEFTERLVDQNGAPAGNDRYHVVGRLVGQTLHVDLRLNQFRWRARLKKAEQRFGLDVAKPPPDLAEAARQAEEK